MDEPDHIPACPRCGYDLSGLIASWAQSCPLDGTCSECGLDWRWADLLNARISPPRWSFEHALRAHALALARTWLISLRPWRLWREMRMEHPVHPRRLAVIAAGGLFAGHAAAAAITLAAALAILFFAGTFYGGVRAYFAEVNGIALLWPYGQWRLTGRSVWSPLGYNACDPWVAVLAVWWLALPLAYALLPVTLRRARVRPAHIARVWACSMVLLPLALASWSVPGLVELLADGAGPLIEMWTGARPWVLVDGVWRWHVFVTAAAAWMTGVVFWGLAARRYLRLPHAWGVAVALSVLSLLVVLTIAMLMPTLGGAMLYRPRW